jgi:hypothetical protein
MLQLLIEERFGKKAIKNGLGDRILAADAKQLDRWAKRILTAKTINDVFSD